MPGEIRHLKVTILPGEILKIAPFLLLKKHNGLRTAQAVVPIWVSHLFLFQGVFMKKLIPFIAVATMAFTGLGAQAQVVKQKASSGMAKAEGALDKGLASQGLKNQGLYGELGLSLLSYKISNYGISAKPIMLRGIVGYDYNPQLAAEAMLGLGLRGGGATGYFGSAYNVSAGTMIGVYAKPRLQLGDMEVF